MSGTEKKVLKIGLGGVAAALLMAGGQASAATCTPSTPVATVLAVGFSCTLGDSTFSNFTASGENPQAVVEFFAISPTMNAVTLGRDGGMIAAGTLAFNFTVTEATSHVIEEASVGIDVGTITPATSTGPHLMAWRRARLLWLIAKAGMSSSCRVSERLLPRTAPPSPRAPS